MSSTTHIKKSKVGAADLCHECAVSVLIDDSANEFFATTLGDSSDTPFLKHVDEDERSTSVGLERKWHDKLPDLPAMAETADAGCHFCQFLQQVLLRKQILSPGPVEVRARYLWGYDRDRFDTRNDGLVAWTCGVFNGDKQLCIVNFNIETSSEEIRKWLRMDKKRCPEPLEPSNIDWMKGQIQRCEEQCDHTAYDPKYLPTRLIDVGTQPGDDARLVITADLPKSQDDRMSHSAKYATLSYCWGPKEDAKQQVKTTRDNLSLHLNRMPLSEMSPVVEDTILVCRALNIRYLWVDALCILQGDARDWDKESEMMGKVYYCSYLTICPLVSTSCMQGYLTPRAPGIEIEFQSSLRPGVQGTYSIFECRENVVPDRPPSLLSRHLDKNQSSWPTRGWTFQEDILSLRILFFGESMSHFSCENKDASENGYLVDNSSGHCQGRRLIESESLSLDSVCKRIEIYDQWDFIKMIQGRKWTYKEDFLPGLSGIAKQYATMVNDVYLAGHWKNNLLYDLTWEVCWPEPGDLDKRMNLLRNPSPYVAPSWSWASQESKVDRAIDTQYILEEQGEEINETDENRFKLWSYTTTQMCHTRSEFKLEDFKMDLWGVSPFGRLKGGFIRVSGKVVPFPSKVLIRKREDSGRHDFGYFTDGLGTCQFDWTSQLDTVQEPGRMRLLPITSCCSSTSNWRRIIWYANPEDNPEELRRNLIESNQLCRALGTDWVERQDCKCCKDEGLARNAWGLIIHPAEEPGSFYRVGVFLLPAYSGGSNLFKDIESQIIMLI